MMDFEPPIQNLDSIDLLGARVDGGVDLGIVCSGPLDDSADTLRLINQKIAGYLGEVRTPEFQSEFGSPATTRIRIILCCKYSVSVAARGLINVLAKKAALSGVELTIDDA